MAIEKIEIVLEYVFDQDDRKRLKKELIRSKEILLPTILFPIIAILLIEITEVLSGLATGFSTGDIIYMILFPISLLLMGLVLIPIFVRWLEKMDELPLNCKVIISDNGINADLTSTTYSIKWDYLTRVIERKEFIYFKIQQIATLTIPKRNIDSNQLEKIRNVLSDNFESKKIKLLVDDRSNNKVVENNGKN